MSYVLKFNLSGVPNYLRIPALDADPVAVTDISQASHFHTRSGVVWAAEKFKGSLDEWGAVDVPTTKEQVVRVWKLSSEKVLFDHKNRAVTNPTCGYTEDPPHQAKSYSDEWVAEGGDGLDEDPMEDADE
jgi:hypothetical protein